jgi:hypothetical protein
MNKHDDDKPGHDLPGRPHADHDLPKPPKAEHLPAEPSYPALRWNQETGQEVTVQNAAEDKALGPGYANHPPPPPEDDAAPKRGAKAKE